MFAPKPGDVVLIQEPKAPRREWPFGVVEKVDARQVQADVQVVEKISRFDLLLEQSYKKRIITRTSNKLYPIQLVPRTETQISTSTCQ